jgi:hypothetical protein
MNTLSRSMIALLLAGAAALPSVVAIADESAPKAIVALVGDMDCFNVGQDGYCGKQTEIEKPTDLQLKIPSNTKTFFFVRTTFRVQPATYYCEGDYSFVPEPGKLHIIRYALEGRQRKLEVLNTVPCSTPQLFPFEQEPRRSCLLP